MNPDSWIFWYIVIHILTFIVYRYYWLADVYRTRNDHYLTKKYPLFQRKDLDIGIITSFPWYITYWPRFFCAQFFLILVGALCVILTIGVKDTTKLSGTRYKIMRAAIKFSARNNLY